MIAFEYMMTSLDYLFGSCQYERMLLSFNLKILNSFHSKVLQNHLLLHLHTIHNF